MARLDRQDKKLDEVGAKIEMESRKLQATVGKVQKVVKGVGTVMGRVSALESRAVDQEARSRRKNILIHGVAESDGEVCLEMVSTFIKERLKIPDKLPIQRAHSLRTRRGGNAIGSQRDKPRPITASFIDFRDWERVRAALKELSPPYGISETCHWRSGKLGNCSCQS